jgi:hypothetical protein
MHLPLAVPCALIHLWVNYDAVRVVIWRLPLRSVREMPISDRWIDVWEQGPGKLRVTAVE